MPEVVLKSDPTSTSNIRSAELEREDISTTLTSGSGQILNQALPLHGMYVPMKNLTYYTTAVVAVVKVDLNPVILWSEGNKLFTREDLIDDADEKVQDLIYQFKTSGEVHHGETIAARLLALFHDAKEEDPTSPKISDGSLRNVYNFLKSLKFLSKVKCPAISLTPDHNIYASWRVGEGRLFSIHFLPGADVRFVVFKPNERHPGQQIRVSGTSTADTLMETVTPYRVLDWISE